MPTVRKDRLCSISGCNHHHYGKNFCSKHYERWRKHGDPSVVKSVPRKYHPICSVEDCDNSHCSQGFCKRHYERWRKYGVPTETAYKECPRCGGNRYAGYPVCKTCRRNLQRDKNTGRKNFFHRSTLLESIADRLYRAPNGHWYWNGAISNKTPYLYFQKKRVNARTFLFKHQYKEVPPRLIINVCGDNTCINPEHQSPLLDIDPILIETVAAGEITVKEAAQEARCSQMTIRRRLQDIQ